MVQEVCHAIGLATVPISSRESDANYTYALEILRPQWVFVDDLLRPRFCKLATNLIPSECILSLTTDESIEFSLSTWISTKEGLETRSHWIPERRRIVLTSGTTGKPKFVIKNGQSHPTHMKHLLDRLKLAKGAHKHLVTVPLHYSAPLAFTTMSLTAGGTVILTSSAMKASVLSSTLTRFECTSTFMPPTLLQNLLKVIGDRPTINTIYPCLEVVWIGGMPCRAQIKLAALRLGLPLYEFYGSSELGFTTVASPADIEKVPDSCGLPLERVSIRIVDEKDQILEPHKIGIVMVSSQSTTFDYCINMGNLIKPREWMSVGDLGYLDQQGYLYLVDRQPDEVNFGGIKIHTYEIECVLSMHPFVKDVAVLGIPDPHYGQILHAAIVLHPETSLLTLEDLARHLARHISSFKFPRSLSYHDRLPRSDIGKVCKWKIRERLLRTSKL